MKLICFLLCSAITIVLASCTTTPQETTVDATPRYDIMTHREDDVVAPQVETGRVTFDIVSPSGISSVVIGADNGTFPAEVVLNLHLSGLEGVTVMYGNVAVQAGVASSAPHDVWQTVRIGFAEPLPIGEESPYWLDITVEGTESAVVPLQDGYFELRLPDDFAAGDHAAFSAEWVDFYR